MQLEMIHNTVEQLRASGHAVVIFTPKELGKADPELFEWNLGDKGAEILDKLHQEPPIRRGDYA